MAPRSNSVILVLLLVGLIGFATVLLPQMTRQKRTLRPPSLENEVAAVGGKDMMAVSDIESASHTELVQEVRRLRRKVKTLQQQRQESARPALPNDEYERIREMVLDEFDGDAMNASDLTLVTALFDLGRGENTMNGFKRPFQEYVDRFKRVLNLGFPTVIYMPKEIFEKYFKEEVKKLPKYHMMYKTNEEIQNEFPYYDLVQKIRKRPGWAEQAGWLPDAPQAKLHLYNPLVMSKVYWLGEVAKLNPLKTKYFLWLDGGHLCAPGLTPSRMGVFKQYMSSRFLVTHFPYLPNTEIHGFEHEAFDRFLGVTLEDDLERHHVRVVRGGVFGGRQHAIGPVVELYDYWLNRTLNEGFMGTEENIFSLALYSHPELFHSWDNGGGDFCTIFDRSQKGCSRAYPLKWKLEE